MKQGIARESRALVRLFQDGTTVGVSDRALLARFADHRDETAFEAILCRHGSLVLNICGKLLSDPQDVEDAFQATFVVLVEKANRLAVQDSLAPWLSTVAYRVASKARARRIRRHRRESAVNAEPLAASDDPHAREQSLAVHEELDCLPDRLRLPIVCCYLEGMTHEQAASRLACPVGTIRSRLARARARLHDRLSRRGVTLSEGSLSLALLARSRTELSSHLIRSTLALISQSASRFPGAIALPVAVLELVEGALAVMNFQKAVLLCGLFIPLTAILTVGIAMGFPQTGEAPRPEAAVKKQVRSTQGSPPEETMFLSKTYYVGDLLFTKEQARNIHEQQVRGVQPAVEVAPLIQLITSTIEPGTWSIQDQEGKELDKDLNAIQIEDKNNGRPLGRIIPFYLSISLIIRHTPEVHERVATLLKYLREYRERFGPDANHGNDQEAEKTFKIGDYYKRIGKASSAEYYFGKIPQRWPDSSWAAKAKAELAKLIEVPRDRKSEIAPAPSAPVPSTENTGDVRAVLDADLARNIPPTVAATSEKDLKKQSKRERLMMLLLEYVKAIEEVQNEPPGE